MHAFSVTTTIIAVARVATTRGRTVSEQRKNAIQKIKTGSMP